jgi:hypothetical protein
MRALRLLIALALFVSLIPVLASASAVAQQATGDYAPLPCTTYVDVVRLSELKPGMMAKFYEAVALQQAWYRKAGGPDIIEIRRVTQRDPATREYKISETQIVTSHIEPALRKEPAHDAGFDAFVALFNESCTIKLEYRTCITRP